MGLDPAKLPREILEKLPASELAHLGLSPAHRPSSTNLIVQPSTDESKLNKTERAWLHQLRLTHPPENLGIQSHTLKLADDTRYTPDFWTIDANGQLFFWEVKGFWRDDAKVKIKVAARQFRHFRFIVVTKTKTGWQEFPIQP